MLQFPFDFQSDKNFLREDFIVSDANNAVFSYIEKWPSWGNHRFSPLLYIHGPKGSGKTHLAHIWQQQTHAIFIRNLQLPLENYSGCYIIDNVEYFIETEEPLLHFINNVVENKGFLLLTSSTPPAQLSISLPDLESRIKALPSVGVFPPDDALLHAVLAKHFSDRQLRVDPEVFSYLLTRIERSFSAVTSIVELLDKQGLAEKRNITIPFVREILSKEVNIQ